MPAVSIPRFNVLEHGFPFANSWEPGTPVVTIPTPFGMLNLGDASGGVCGGMVFAAADFYLAEQPIPRETTHDVIRYCCRRLLDSWALPFGVMRYYEWQRRPGHSVSWLGTRLQSGVTWLTVVEEWPKIKAEIDRGMPAPLGLVKVHSWSFAKMAQNHQVLCHGYRDSGTHVELQVYDPNWPGQNVILNVDITSPEQECMINHSIEGTTIRGVFLTDYSKPQIAYPA